MEGNLKVKVLLVGHRASLGGADRYMYDQARMLLEYGYSVRCIAFEGGPLEEIYEQKEIPFSIYIISQLNVQKIYSLVKEFDIIVANTMYAVFFAYEAQKYKPTMLILHECLSHMKNMIKRTRLSLEELKRIRHLYGVSEYQADKLNEIGLERVQVLNNFVTDVYSLYQNKSVCSKIRFLTVANWNWVKGYDLALEAFLDLTVQEKKQIEWHIVGDMESEPRCQTFLDIVKDKKWIVFHGGIKEKENLYVLYSKCDVYIHIARDDSCSLAVVDAAMLNKPIIVSKDTGASYLVGAGAGWIVDEYNSKDVLNAIREALAMRDKFMEMGERARKNYLKAATPEVYIGTLIREFDMISKEDRAIAEHYDIQSAENKMIKKSRFRIALYGYNMYTQVEYFYYKKSHTYELVGIYDRDYEKFRNRGIDIRNPEELETINFDFVCICCVYDSTIRVIEAFLTGMGVPKDKIYIGISSVPGLNNKGKTI